jgi:hypothetical protein
MAATGARSPQFAQNQSGGAFAYADIRRHPADVWFVDSTNSKASDTAGFGQNPDLPFATLQYANTLAADSVGDVIYLMPGHVETVTGAGLLTLDCIGLTVRGLGEGALQPIIICTTINTVDILINAASITIEDVHFVAGVQDIIAMIDVDATDFTLRRCRFTENATDENALIMIQDGGTTTSNRITVEYCEAILNDADNTHFINLAGTGDGHIIRNNVLIGDWGTITIGGAGAVTHIQITDNLIHNQAITADSGINVANAATGLIFNNRIGINLAADDTSGVDADACAMCQNFVVDHTTGGDVTGVLDP